MKRTAHTTTRSLLFIWILILYGCAGSKQEEKLLTSGTETPAKEITVKRTWERKTGSFDEQHLRLRPSVHKNVIYTCNSKGRIAALRSNSGVILWETNIQLPIAGGIEADHRLAVVGTLDGEVVALSSQNGKPLWRVRVSSEILAPPKIHGTTVLVRTIDGKVFALSSQNGQRLWFYQRAVPTLTLRGTSAPIIANDKVIVGLDNGLLLALALQDGRLLWENPLHQPQGKTELDRLVDIDAEPVVSNNTVYAVTFQGQLASVNLDSGRTNWSRQLSSLAGLAVDSSRIYVTDDENKLQAINSTTGELVWEQDDLTDYDLTGPTVWGRYLVLGDAKGSLHILDSYDGTIATPPLTNNNDGFSLAPIKNGDHNQLLMYDHDGYIIAFTLNE